MPPPLESDSSPAVPRLVLAVVPVLVTHPRAMTSRPCLRSGPRTPGRLACRRHALETVEKIVTAGRATAGLQQGYGGLSS